VQRGRRFVVHAARARSLQQRVRQFFRRVRLGCDLIRQTNAAIFLPAREQIQTFEAAKSEIAIQHRRRVEHRKRALAAEFFKQATHNLQNSVSSSGFVELCGGRCHFVFKTRSRYLREEPPWGRGYHAWMQNSIASAASCY